MPDEQTTREWVVTDLLKHRCMTQLAVEAPTEAIAADWVRDHIGTAGRASPGQGSWFAHRRGICYSDPGGSALPRPENGYPVITWRELVNIARTGATQPALPLREGEASS